MCGGAIQANSGSVVVLTEGRMIPTLAPSRYGLARTRRRACACVAVLMVILRRSSPLRLERDELSAEPRRPSCDRPHQAIHRMLLADLAGHEKTVRQAEVRGETAHRDAPADERGGKHRVSDRDAETSRRELASGRAGRGFDAGTEHDA